MAHRLTTSDGVDLNYSSESEGSPVLLLHGLGSRGEDWRPQIDALSASHQVITVDMRGHGSSQIPTHGYDLHRFAADAREVLDALNVHQAHVVGLSMGGGVAFALAVDSPERVRSLCIVNSGPSSRPPNLKFRLFIWMRRIMARLYKPGDAAPKIAERLFPGDDADMQDKRAQFIDQLKGMDATAYRKSLNAVLDFHVADRIAGLHMPTLFVASEFDYTPPEAKQRFVDMMPNARLEVVKDAHHALPIEAPGKFNPLLKALLVEAEGA
jgi:pimeloyl-ACP methyl ester carboxylesterase